MDIDTARLVAFYVGGLAKITNSGTWYVLDKDGNRLDEVPEKWKSSVAMFVGKR